MKQIIKFGISNYYNCAWKPGFLRSSHEYRSYVASWDAYQDFEALIIYMDKCPAKKLKATPVS